MKNQDTIENTAAVSGGSDALVSLLRNPPRHDYDGYKVAQLMTEAANEIERLRNTLGEIAGYKGEGGPNTPWQAIVRDLGQTARDSLANTADQRRSPE